jgi:CRP-like cAMP-binding protein
MISPELLRRFPLFAGLSPALLKEIAFAGEELELKKGDWLFHQNAAADALYLVISGVLEPTIDLSEGDTHYAPLPRLIEGEVAGWSALVEPNLYQFGAMADTNSRVIRLDAARLLDLMGQNPAAGYAIMRKLAQIIGQRLTNLRIQFVSMMEKA